MRKLGQLKLGFPGGVWLYGGSLRLGFGSLTLLGIVIFSFGIMKNACNGWILDFDLVPEVSYEDCA